MEQTFEEAALALAVGKLSAVFSSRALSSYCMEVCMEHKMHERLRYFPPGQVIETESGSHIILRVEPGWGGEEMRAASPDKAAAAAPAAAAVPAAAAAAAGPGSKLKVLTLGKLGYHDPL
jgi:hypothetical protein